MNIELVNQQKQEDSNIDQVYVDCSLILKYPINQRKQSKMFADNSSLMYSQTYQTDTQADGLFRQKYFSLDQQTKQSLFKKKNSFRRENKIKVYFFDMSTSYDFDTLELRQLDVYMSVKKFIKVAILKYFEQIINFIPSKIKTHSFSLTLLNDRRQYDIDITQESQCNILDQDARIKNFYGQHLMIKRTKCKVNQNREQFEKIEFNADIFQLELTFQNSRTLIKLDKNNKDYTVSHLIKEALKKSKSYKPISEFLIVTYDNFKIYPITERIQNIRERKFQIFSRKQPVYIDQQQSQKPCIQFEKKRQKISRNLFTVFIQNHKKSVNRKKISTTIYSGFFMTMTLEIVQNEFVEIYNEGSIISQIISLICEKQSVIRYSFGNLISAYIQQNELVLIFYIKKQKVMKRYQMAKNELRIFLEEIIRLAQLYRKILLNHDI